MASVAIAIAQGMIQSPIADHASSYEVEVEDQVRRIYPKQVNRRVQSSPDPPPIILPSPAEVSMLRLVWRAIKRTLSYWFPPDPPNIIAIIRMPERIYCARCGTVRVSKYCPSCGANIDRQFKKMVLKMSQYVVEASEPRRHEIARAVQAQVEIRMAEMCEAQRKRVEKKLATLERSYVMQMVRQKRGIDQVSQMPTPGQLITQKRVDRDDGVFNTTNGLRTLSGR